MLAASRLGVPGALRQLLCLGAHSDDIEIGCGGTILRLIEENPGLEVHWVVFSGRGARGDEARHSAAAFLAGAGKAHVTVQEFRDGFFPYDATPIKEFFERLKTQCQPDLVLTHLREDRHQDHRLISDLTYNTFRDHLIAEYEIFKVDGDLGNPNLYVQLDEGRGRRKVELLLQHFATQRGRHWFTEDVFWALMRLRGVECCAPGRLAEAFTARKLAV